MMESTLSAYHENIKVQYDCGCAIGYNRYANDYAILYCPTHAAAPKLLGVAQDCLGYFKGEWAAVGNHPASRVTHYIKFLEGVIDQATPPDMESE